MDLSLTDRLSVYDHTDSRPSRNFASPVVKVAPVASTHEDMIAVGEPFEIAPGHVVMPLRAGHRTSMPSSAWPASGLRSAPH